MTLLTTQSFLENDLAHSTAAISNTNMTKQTVVYHAITMCTASSCKLLLKARYTGLVLAVSWRRLRAYRSKVAIRTPRRQASFSCHGVRLNSPSTGLFSLYGLIFQKRQRLFLCLFFLQEILRAPVKEHAAPIA